MQLLKLTMIYKTLKLLKFCNIPLVLSLFLGQIIIGYFLGMSHLCSEIKRKLSKISKSDPTSDIYKSGK